MDEMTLELKSMADDGSFEGWAARYGNVDNQGDRILPGAFSADVGKDVPLLWAHKRDEVVGVGRLEETPEGLLVKGQMLLDTVAGRETYARVKAGAARGLSIGFRLLQHVFEGAVRVVQRGAVAEVSFTPFPANPAALVTAVKSDAVSNPTARWLVQALRLAP